MPKENLILEIREALVDAIDVVEHLEPSVPPDLRSTALVETFRALRDHSRGESTSGESTSQPEAPQHAAGPPATDLPSPSLVTSKGSRIQKAIYAAVKLAERGDPATAAAIGKYSKEEMASEIKKIPDVLREATPVLVERSKEDRVFVYSPTPEGLAELARVGE